MYVRTCRMQRRSIRTVTINEDILLFLGLVLALRVLVNVAATYAAGAWP